MYTKYVLLFSFKILLFISGIDAQTTEPFDLPRFLGTSVVAGDTAYFAGGAANGLIPQTQINGYDRSTGNWFEAELSVPRVLLGAAATEGKVIFAGGLDPREAGPATDRVDFYDRASGEWSTGTLSSARALPMAVATDSLTFIAGGLATTTGIFGSLEGLATIDVYNENTDSWSMTELSEPRGAGAAVRVGNYLIFAGGLVNENQASKRVDIYDIVRNEWSIDSLSSPRFFLSGVSDGSKAYFAGGSDVDNTHDPTVDIYDPETRQWSMASLSRGRVGISAGFSCGQVIFAGGANNNWDTRFITQAFSDMDRYDPVNDEWTTQQLDVARYAGMPAAFDDRFMVATGFSNTLINTTVTYACDFLNNLEDQFASDNTFHLSPNPVAGGQPLQLNWDGGIVNSSVTHGLTFRVVDMLGKVVRNGKVSNTSMLEFKELPPGQYVVQVVTKDGLFFRPERMIVR